MSERQLPAGARRTRLHWIVLGALFLARLGFAALVYQRPELAIANDSDRYVPLANAILSGDAYRWNTDRPGELLNTVGYPLFLAAVFATFGREPGDVALAQLLLSGVAALLAYAVLRTRLGPTAGFVTATVLLLEPLTILWSMTILTETLFAFTVCMSALALAAWAFSRRAALLVVSGALVGIACLVRPVGLALAAGWAIAVFLLPDAGDGTRAAKFVAGARRTTLFLLPCVALLAPWVIRNALLWDCPTLSSVDRVTTRDYIAAKIIVETEHVTLEEAQARLQAADPGMCPQESEKYRKMILDNGWTYLRLHAAGTVPVLIATNFDRWLQYLGVQYELPDLWRPYMDGGLRGLLDVVTNELRIFPEGLGLMLALSAWQLCLYLLAALGALAAWRTKSRVKTWFAAVLVMGLLILLITPGQSGHERFRVPMQPLLAILIGCWVAWTAASRRFTGETPP